MDSDTDLPMFEGTGCDILFNLKEISEVMGALADKLHGVESQLFEDKGVQPLEMSNTLGGTSPLYNKWIRLSALYQLLFRSIAAHGASEDDIIMLALGIQMKQRATQEAMFQKAFEDQMQSQSEDTEEETTVFPPRRTRSKKVH
jgi:hypothetical protein